MKTLYQFIIWMIMVCLLVNPVSVTAKELGTDNTAKEAGTDNIMNEGGTDDITDENETENETGGNETGNAAKENETENVTMENTTENTTEEATESTTESPENETTSSKTTSAELMIDNQNRYEGMEKTYSEGYMPKVENGMAVLVVPILCNGKLKDNQLTVTLNLGSSSDIPFVCRNYEKTVFLGKAAVNDGNGMVEGYLAAFNLELKENRYNGNYPVTLTIKAYDENGNQIVKEITEYVSITDGSNPDAQIPTEAPTKEPPTFAPKIMIESCGFSKTDIQAGDEVTVEITLINTSKTEKVKNMTVTANAQKEYFNLLSQSDSIWIDSIPAGGKYIVTYIYEVRADAPQGQYDVELAMDYADSKGNGYSGTGKVKMTVGQQVRMQFDPLNISSSVEVADVVEAKLQAMNLGRGKIYNIRAVIEADGLSPEGTMFIGNLEAGKTAEGSVKISVSGLSQGDILYGKTEGKVIIYYEDESGKEYEEEMYFATTIKSPFSDTVEEPEDKTGQWWIVMAVIGGVLGVFLIYAVVQGIRRRKAVK